MNKKYALVPVYIFMLVFQACSNPSPTPVSEPTKTATPLATSTSTPTLTVTPTSTSTPIPLAWTQIYDGQEFERDMVTAFATDEKDANVIYAGMKNSGVYKTVDGGLSWLPVNQGLTSKKVESLFIDSQSPLILYAGTLDGVFKTEDGGGNWSKISEGTSLLMDLQNNSHLYARDENGIYETRDQGNNWTTTHTLKKDCPNAISSWAIHPANGDMLLIGGGETCMGVYQSTDKGHSWKLIGLEDITNINMLAIGLAEERGFSIYTSSTVQRGMYVSHDGGANWSDTSVQTDRCDILTSDPNDPSTIYCAGSTRLSVKRGRGPWQEIRGTNSTSYTAIYIDHPDGTERIIAGTVYISTDYPYIGIFISTDGGISWAKRNVGIGSSRSELKIDPVDSTRIYLATYYIRAHSSCTLYNSLDSGKSWSPRRGRGTDWCGPTFDAHNDFYLMERGALQMSSDSGKTWLWEPVWIKFGVGYIWDPVNLLPSYYQGRSESISANPYTEGLVYDIGDKIYYKTGSGWQMSNGSEGLRDARLFYTDQSKMIFAIGRVHQKYSTDNGKTWQACGEDVTTAQSDSRLALDLQGNKLYLATPGRGVLVSMDKCGSWQASNNGLGNLFVNTVAMDPNNPDIVYAGTDSGAYVSFDSGEIWGQINDGLIGGNIVYSIAVDSESNVYAATPYGVFKLEQK